LKKFFRENGLLLLIIALLLSALIWVGSLALGVQVDPIGNLTNTVLTPVRNGISAVLDWAEGVYTYVFHYEEMADELDSLRRQVAELKEEVRQGKEASRENEQLRELLGLRAKRRDLVFESAKVTGRGTATWDSTLTLSKGSASGVEINDCVITETGILVGVVSQVGLNWCTVDTILSPNTEMGGQITRTNTAGILEGELSLMLQERVRLSYLPLESELMAGDEVLTSGRGEIYPSGIVVGTVEEVTTDPSGMFLCALVDPLVELDTLVEVFIITEFDIVD